MAKIFKFRLDAGVHFEGKRRYVKGGIVTTGRDLCAKYKNKFTRLYDEHNIVDDETTEDETTDEVEDEVVDTDDEEATEDDEDEGGKKVEMIRVKLHRGGGKYNVYEIDEAEYEALENKKEVDEICDPMETGLTRAKADKLIKEA